MHISSIYAKILGETNFQPWEFPRSGSEAKVMLVKVRTDFLENEPVTCQKIGFHKKKLSYSPPKLTREKYNVYKVRLNGGIPSKN